MITLMTADDWISKYKPVMENNSIKMYETYGEEFDFVKTVEPRKVWTTLAEDNDIFVESGYRWVNRICYIITEIPWEEGRYWDNAIIVDWP